MSWFSFICLHLQWFGWAFLQKQFSTFSLLWTHSWMKTRKFAHFATLACLFYWVICNRPHSLKAEDGRRNQKLFAFQDTCTLVPALPVACCIKLVQSLLQPCHPASSLAEDLSLTVHCTINSITGPWYWLELPAATLKDILTAIINKRCYMRFPVQGRLSVLHSVSATVQ